MIRRVVAFSSFFAICAPSLARGDCVETAPSSGERPELVDTFPSRGTSGYATTLHVVVTHGRGETVLPRGLELQSEGDSARALKEAGFSLPEQDAGAGARLSREDADEKTDAGTRRRTTLDLPLVALPTEPGRHVLTLPPLPVAVARASGDVITLCTKAHSIVVDDPTASTPNAEPRPNPPLRPQREEWIGFERALVWTLAGIVLGSLLAWSIHRWRKRPKPAPPPPPPRIPWEVALERLDEARHAGLLEMARFSEFFDRVNDAIREYLGARFGFDGLESTTDEMLVALRAVPHFSLSIPEIASFLQQCDLVKFADWTPTIDECRHALVDAERIVRTTMPSASRAASPEPDGGPS